MQVLELVLCNSDNDPLGMVDVTLMLDDDGELNMGYAMNDNNVRNLLSVLREGDSIKLVERWSER